MRDTLPFNTDHRGFTLIEMVVVLALLALLLAVTLPRLAANPFSDGKRKTSLWLSNAIKELKVKSLQESRNHALHIDIDTGHLWVTHASMQPEDVATARRAAFTLPAGSLIESVEFPDSAQQTAGQAVIRFSQKGYSQMALIQAKFEDNSRRSFLIEPFLTRVKIYEEPVRINK